MVLCGRDSSLLKGRMMARFQRFIKLNWLIVKHYPKLVWNLANYLGLMALVPVSVFFLVSPEGSQSVARAVLGVITFQLLILVAAILRFFKTEVFNTIFNAIELSLALMVLIFTYAWLREPEAKTAEPLVALFTLIFGFLIYFRNKVGIPEITIKGIAMFEIAKRESVVVKQTILDPNKGL